MKKEIREVMYDFIQTLQAMNKRKEDIHQYGKVVMQLLPLLKIKEGYELDFYQFGGDTGSRYEPYVCKAGATEPYIPTVYEDGTPVDFKERHSIHLDLWEEKEEVPKKIHIPYDESKRVVDMLAVHEYDDIPKALPYFEVPFTEDGIMQAWLLENISNLLPLFWHCNYNKVYYILNEDEIKWGAIDSYEDENFIEAREFIEDLDLSVLYPEIVIKGAKAQLTVHYWNAWRGLVRKDVKAMWQGKGVEFDENEEITVLVPYKSGIRF